MLHEMKLQDDPFKKISDRTKTIEMRLYDEKRKKVKVGDLIEFTNVLDNEKLITRIAKLYDLEDNLVLHPKARCSKCPFQLND